MKTLYDMLNTQKKRFGMTEALNVKVDIFYFAGRLTEDEYKDLMDIPVEEEEVTMPQEVKAE